MCGTCVFRPHEHRRHFSFSLTSTALAFNFGDPKKIDEIVVIFSQSAQDHNFNDFVGVPDPTPRPQKNR